MHDKGITLSIIILLIASLLFFTGTYENLVGYLEDGDLIPNGPVACSAEAKLCPDGSVVSRVGPDCQFALCPGEISSGESTSEYPITEADRLVGTPAAVNFTTYPRAEEFKTVLTTGAALGPNFAGHYTIIEWGCGTGCQSFAVVDARDGRIVAYAIPAIYGAAYALDSRLLVTNPQKNATEMIDPTTSISATSEHYLMDNGELQLMGTRDARTNTPLSCVQVIASAKNPITGETRDFPTPCDIPSWWEKL